MKKWFVFVICLGLLQAAEVAAESPEKTAIGLEELSGLNLKISEIPPIYLLKKGKSGYENHDKVAVDMVYYESGEGRQNILSSLSLYDTAGQAACGFDAAKAAFSRQRDGNIDENAAAFGQKSATLVAHYADPKTGDYDLYEMIFSYGNVVATIRVGAPEGEVSQKEAAQYARTVEKNLQKDCPKCAQAESCSQ